MKRDASADMTPTGECFQPTEIFTTVQLALPEGQIVIANRRLRTLSLLNLRPSSLPLLAQAHFSASEWSVLLVLLRTFPHDASYAELSTALSGHEPAQDTGYFESMRNRHIPREALRRPLRELMSGVRLKLRPFGLGIMTDRDLGYRVVSQSASRRGESDVHPRKTPA